MECRRGEELGGGTEKEEEEEAKTHADVLPEVRRPVRIPTRELREARFAHARLLELDDGPLAALRLELPLLQDPQVFGVADGLEGRFVLHAGVERGLG